MLYIYSARSGQTDSKRKLNSKTIYMGKYAVLRKETQTYISSYKTYML